MALTRMIAIATVLTCVASLASASPACPWSQVGFSISCIATVDANVGDLRSESSEDEREEERGGQSHGWAGLPAGCDLAPRRGRLISPAVAVGPPCRDRMARLIRGPPAAL
ncbi:MAG: hypothetical protein ACKOEX_12560 [Planctomycetia bacterium]